MSLIPEQIAMLKEAESRLRGDPGSIRSIFIVAADTGDEDTIDYILDHYLNETHFTRTDIDILIEAKKAK